MDGLIGIRFGDWVSVLADNHFAVSPKRLLPAGFITARSLFNSWAGWKERRMFDAQVAGAEVREPIFVLGHWRSGTTLLHNLLVTDPQFAFPNAFETSNPLTFLRLEKIVARKLGEATTRRPQDNVEYGMFSPGEDEFGTCAMSLRSPVMGWNFPRREAYYDRYLTFRGVPEAEVREWQRALLDFLKKLTWKYQRPLILKSPQHTCRIRLLLEMFPDARFIHIHRNPYDVFHSTLKLYEKVISQNHLHAHPHRAQITDILLRRYTEMYDAFFAERGLIAADRYHEVGFEELEKEMVEQVRQIYDRLKLPGFAAHEPELQQYADSLTDYQKNVHPKLDETLRRKIAQHWRRSFEAWNYPV